MILQKLNQFCIFDKDTQIGLNKKESSGANYCIKNKILFYLFSIEEFKLYNTDDLNIFILTEKFESNKMTKKLRRTHNESRGDFSFFENNEVQLINELIEDDILNNYTISEGKNIIDNLKKYNKNFIYIFFIKNEKIYIINQKLYSIENGELKIVAKKNINQKEIYEAKILKRFDQDKRLNKNFKKYIKK